MPSYCESSWASLLPFGYRERGDALPDALVHAELRETTA